MKQKIKKEIEVEVSVCDICKLEITKEPFNKKRIDIIHGLFNTLNFDAHEKCINQAIRDAFGEYFA